jgi:hypothetical protein
MQCNYIQCNDKSIFYDYNNLNLNDVLYMNACDMNNITCLQHALYINLESRTDRRAHVEAQLAAIKTADNGLSNLVPERFNAIQHVMHGAIGCSMSHMRCIQIAKERGWDHVLICEDDVLFTNVPLFLTQLAKFMATVPTWDVVLLAGNNIPPFNVVNDACIQVGSCQTIAEAGVRH